ncbi:MAG: C25 family cysteine peptidase [Saprospiraceae bacterium]
MKIVSKLLFTFIIFVSLFDLSIGQSKFGNEWINPSKTYLKLKIAQNGIYKVSYEELVAAGFLSNRVNGADLQLINFGEDQALYISDNDFGPGDHFEFYGEKNTIGLDSLLYDNWKQDLLNPDYSLVNDTNAYFLTLAPEKNNLRYIIKNPNYANTTLTPFPYYLHEEKEVFSSFYFKNVDAGPTRHSIFEPSEGFGQHITNKSNISFKTSHLSAVGPLPKISMRTGLNGNQARLEILWNGITKSSFITPAKITVQWSKTLELAEINNSNTLIIQNTYSTSDQHILANASLIYSRQFFFDNKADFSFAMTPQSSQRLLEINDFKSSGGSAFLYDFKNKTRYNTSIVGDKVRVIIDGSQDTTSYKLVSTVDGYLTVPVILTFKPLKWEDEGQQYIILTNKTLYNSGPNYIQDYADYRASQEGGNYKTKIVEIQDIYDNFGNGIDRHFMAVKRFAGFMNTNWKSTEYVFLIGKGVEYPYVRTADDINNYRDLVFFVPTFGFTGSDNMLFSEGNYPNPYFAIGRLAARTGSDIKNYLDKVKLHDASPFMQQTIEDKYWMKQILHLGGGKTDSEQRDIKNGLDKIANILEEPIFGAKVYSYFKNSFDAVQFAVNEEINMHFESGVKLVNFFGHSASTSWDFSIQNPKDFNNYGKYPLINSFGCYSGNLHGINKGISESFVLEKDKGSISFYASTGSAFVQDLSLYGYKFFRLQLNENKNKSLGTIIKDLASTYRDTLTQFKTLISQLTFHGDPALKLHIDEAPDYLFNQEVAKSIPATVQAAAQTFEVELECRNIGSFKKDSVDIVFFHEQNNGKLIDTINLRFNGIANQFPIKITLKNYGNISVGRHLLRAKIDPKNAITELPNPDAESNNELSIGNKDGFEFYVVDNVASIVYPPDYAMINTKEHFVLKASTSSAPLAKTDYVFQIDTTAYFNSPMLESGKINSEGGLIVYTPKMTLVANRVYYWRVSPDSLSGQGYKWSQASFAYIPDEDEGWNQSHYFQFAQNSFQDLVISEETGRRFEFGKEYKIIKLRNKVWSEDDKPGYSRNNILFGSSLAWTFLDEGIGIILNNDLNFWNPAVPPGGKFGSFNPTGDPLDVYAFKTSTPQERKLVIDFLENQVINGTYVHFYTIQKYKTSNYHPEDWASDSLLYNKSIISVMEKLGAKQIRSLANIGSVPYIFQMHKGPLGVLHEDASDNIEGIIESISYLYNKTNRGKQATKTIDESKKYKKLKVLFSENNGAKEKSYVNYLKENSSTKIDSFIVSSKDLNKSIPSKIFLENVAYDSTTRTSPQLNFWRLSYDPLPDAAVSFTKSEPNNTNGSIKQGDKLKVYYDIINTNFVPMDSILVKYTLTTSSNQSSTTYKRLKPLSANEKISDVAEFTIGTGSLTDVKVNIEINPNLDQPELHTFNNVIFKQFGVERDITNPLLDVYFDGVRIMDGDIISPKPEIMVTLKDDNTLIPISNAEVFEVKLDTGRNQLLEIPMNSPQIKFTPAGQNNPYAKLFYYPELKDGEYTLYVQGSDATGNKSGLNPRAVKFKVIEKQSVSNVLNYPNPFSTSTQFIFTLTGSEIPDIMSISIMTLSGKVVKEITSQELGPLKIGNNRTEYKWDGTDEFGSKLANGVYLYKVNVRKSNGEKYDHFTNTKADGFFKEGFGKLVILR